MAIAFGYPPCTSGYPASVGTLHGRVPRARVRSARRCAFQRRRLGQSPMPKSEKIRAGAHPNEPRGRNAPPIHSCELLRRRMAGLVSVECAPPTAVAPRISEWMHTRNCVPTSHNHVLASQRFARFFSDNTRDRVPREPTYELQGQHFSHVRPYPHILTFPTRSPSLPRSADRLLELELSRAILPKKRVEIESRVLHTHMHTHAHSHSLTHTHPHAHTHTRTLTHAVLGKGYTVKDLNEFLHARAPYLSPPEPLSPTRFVVQASRAICISAACSHHSIPGDRCSEFRNMLTSPLTHATLQCLSHATHTTWSQTVYWQECSGETACDSEKWQVPNQTLR